MSCAVCGAAGWWATIETFSVVTTDGYAYWIEEWADVLCLTCSWWAHMAFTRVR